MSKIEQKIKKISRQLLIDKKIPVTAPRILLLEILIKNKGPLKVEDVILKSKEKIAISSLYRIINDLKKHNIINEFQTLENTKVIEIIENPKDEHHHHIFCESCNEILDFVLDQNLEKSLEKEILKIEKTHDLSVLSHRLELVMLCQKCK